MEMEISRYIFRAFFEIFVSRPTPMPCLFLIGGVIIRRQGPSWAPDEASFVNRKKLHVNKLAVVNSFLYGG